MVTLPLPKHAHRSFPLTMPKQTLSQSAPPAINTQSRKEKKREKSTRKIHKKKNLSNTAKQRKIPISESPKQYPHCEPKHPCMPLACSTYFSACASTSVPPPLRCHTASSTPHDVQLCFTSFRLEIKYGMHPKQLTAHVTAAHILPHHVSIHNSSSRAGKYNYNPKRQRQLTA